ncbi:MAG: TetR/AcrR family transcriptional regulator [Pseudomonas sp.]
MNAATSAKRKYQGASAEQRKAERRQLLIDAATEVYGRNGYRHSGVKQVCDAAGLTQRYFYESFRHSDELLIACYEQAARHLRELNQAAAEQAGADPLERSRAMLTSYFRTLRDHPNLARLLLIDIRGIGPEVDRAIEAELQASSDDITRTLLQSGHRPNELLQAGILGGVIHIALYWMAEQYATPLEQVTETALQLGAVLLQP